MPRGLCETCTFGATSKCPARVLPIAQEQIVTWCERHIGRESPSPAAQRANSALELGRQTSSPGQPGGCRASWTPRD
jgi:hypothetical protein